MAFLSSFRQVLNRSVNSSSVIQSQLTFIRFKSTLTSPKLFVSGLSRQTTDEGLRGAFAQFGQLVEAKVIIDRASGRSKGFGFVSYSTIEEAARARDGMNAKFLDGWVIFVDPAKPREARPLPQEESQPSAAASFTANKTVGW